MVSRRCEGSSRGRPATHSTKGSSCLASSQDEVDLPFVLKTVDFSEAVREKITMCLQVPILEITNPGRIRVGERNHRSEKEEEASQVR